MIERLVRVPTEVILGWAGLVTEPAVLAKLTVPVRFATWIFDSAFPPPTKNEAVTLPVE